MRHFFLLSLFCFVSLFSEETNTFMELEDHSTLHILTPSLSKRQTAKIQLINGLKVYLVSDKNADQSACALAVRVGSWNDPKKYPGMAHFVEHMLFSGTHAYPKENEYGTYIQDHGGHTNAFTDDDRTCYMFSINNNYFQEALDRFSHFFIDPLFNSSSVGRELFAVDQEYSKNVESDVWRWYQIAKEIGPKEHPNSRFSMGNEQTLSKIAVSTLENWYQTHYSANNMYLVVYSPIHIDQLKRIVAEKFNPVPSCKVDPLAIHAPYHSSKQKGHFVYIKPIQDRQDIILEWDISSNQIEDLSFSSSLIAYALNLGHENSLLSSLKKDLLVEHIEAHTQRIGKHHRLFRLELELTKQGLNQIDSIIQRCFAAINNFKTCGLPAYLFHEMKTMQMINYQYQSRQDAFDFVREITPLFVDENIQTFPQNSFVPTKYDPEAAAQLLESLNPTNCVYYVLADPKEINMTLTKKEKWLGGEYLIKEISKESLQKWEKIDSHPTIAMPKPNPFIPTNLQNLPLPKTEGGIKYPTKIVDHEKAKIFYAQDDLFLLPKASYQFHIKSASFENSAKSAVLMDLYIKQLYDKLESTLSSAGYANMDVNFSFHSFAFHMQLIGYSEKLPLLMQEVLKQMRSKQISKRTYDMYFQSLMQEYENSEKQLPLRQAISCLKSVLTNDCPTSNQKIEALEKISYEEFINFNHHMFTKTFVEGLIIGNLTLKDAESIWLDLHESLSDAPFLSKNHPKKNVISLSNTGPYKLINQTASLGNGIILTIDQGKFSYPNRAAQKILSVALSEAFYNELRTKQKTGYIAHSQENEIEGRLFQHFYVQSNSHYHSDLLWRFEQFIDAYQQDLEENISQDRFDQIRQNIISVLENGPRNLLEMSAYLDKLAFEHNQDFSRPETFIKALKALSYEDFVKISKSFLSRDNKKRLAIIYSGKIPKEKQFFYLPISPKDLSDQHPIK